MTLSLQMGKVTDDLNQGAGRQYSEQGRTKQSVRRDRRPPRSSRRESCGSRPGETLTQKGDKDRGLDPDRSEARYQVTTVLVHSATAAGSRAQSSNPSLRPRPQPQVYIPAIFSRSPRNLSRSAGSDQSTIRDSAVNMQMLFPIFR